MTIAGKTILVVEDEPIIALALEDLLFDGGARPVFASTVEHGGTLIAEQSLDAAILDVNVHGQQSYPLARLLQEKNVPHIFATGYGTTVHPAEFASVPTIAKPYTLADIERAMAAAAARSVSE
jgi:DNA-binding response OmpR family regulator